MTKGAKAHLKGLIFDFLIQGIPPGKTLSSIQNLYFISGTF